jgi:hypothetical protein
MFGIDDAAAATLGAGALGFIGGQLTNDRSADQAAANNAWSAQQYATRYQTQVKDLEAAGLNPMLAYNQSPGSAPTAQAVQFQNPVSSAMDAVRSSSGAVQSHSSASAANASVDLTNANVKKVIAETDNVPLEGRRLERTAALLAEQLNVAFQETQSKIKAREVMDATIRKIKSETTLLNLDASAAEDLDNLGRRSQQLKPIVDIIRSVIRK